MDYEKLHKDTLAKLQDMVNSGKITVEIAHCICADFVPEDEDERIRKNLISWINILYHPCFSERERNEFIAWIERQGKQKSVDVLTQQEAMDFAVAKCFDESNALIKI